MISDGDVFEMYLGLPGSGKTLYTTEEIILPFLLSGVRVFSTYWVNWNKDNFRYIHEFEEVQTERNCVVVFDEVCNILDPRNWESETSGVRNFFQLHRHRFVNIYANTQHLSFIAKSALVVVDKYSYFERRWNGLLTNMLFKNFPWVVINSEEMSLPDLKKMEMPEFGRNEDQDQDIEFTFGKDENFWFNKKKMLHRELDKFKLELIHPYCSLCRHRQGESIPKGETFDYCSFNGNDYVMYPDASLGTCPKHPDQLLELRESTMFDSHYEPVFVPKPIAVKFFTKQVKEVPFRGQLTNEQITLKRKLEFGQGGGGVLE